MHNPRIITSLMACLAISCMVYVASPTALAAVSISSVEYPAPSISLFGSPPDRLAVGEHVPIVVNIHYANLAQSALSLHLVDYNNGFYINGGEVTVSGSGNYTFPPAEISVPSTSSRFNPWPEYINEWTLKAEIRMGDEILAGKDFTMLVEIPDKKPKVDIKQIVVPPGTIVVTETCPVRIKVGYSNLDSTKIPIAVFNRSGILDIGESPPLSGSGEYVFTMKVTPKEAGTWIYWPQYINEWHLWVELLIDDEIAASRNFTLLVENPEKRPKVEISSIEYPAAPETLTIGEHVPVVLNIKYDNLVESDLDVHYAYADYHPRFQRGGNAILSGSGNYQFPPASILVPANQSIPSGWSEFINEWHLKAEIWTVDESELMASRNFTLLVENPERRPKIEIKKIEYVAPPGTIAVHEPSPVKIFIGYKSLDFGTIVEATISDHGKPIASEKRQMRPGSGEDTFAMKIIPNRAGPWDLQAEVHGEAKVRALSSSVHVADKEAFQMSVVPR